MDLSLNMKINHNKKYIFLGDAKLKDIEKAIEDARINDSNVILSGVTAIYELETYNEVLKESKAKFPSMSKDNLKDRLKSNHSDIPEEVINKFTT